MKTRNSSLDSLKGLAIIGVTVCHGSQVFQSSELLNKFTMHGARGVQMFFIISAFLLFTSYAKVDNANVNDKFKWLIKRFIRFIPVYYLALSIQLLGIQDFSETEITIGTIISSYLFVHGFNPYWTNVLVINWYIGTLSIFILLMPVLFRLINSIEKSFFWFVGSWFVSNLINCSLHLFVPDCDERILTYWGQFSITAQLPVLTIGIMLYFVVNKTDVINRVRVHFEKNNISDIGILVALIIWVCTCICYNANYVEFSIVFGLIFLYQLIFKSRIMCNKVFSTLGKYSLVLYLFNYNLLGMVSRFWGGGIFIINLFFYLLVVLLHYV